METIDTSNLLVEGIPFITEEVDGKKATKITCLRIHHTYNAHGYCHIEGIVLPEDAKEFVSRVDETFGVRVTTAAEGQCEKLFYGVIQRVKEVVHHEGFFSTLILDCVTTSGVLDVQECKKTFQQKSQTYTDVLEIMMDGRGTVQMTATDKAIENLIMQCDETDWEFTMRMASHLEVPACINIVSETPQIYIGIPPTSKTVEPKTVSYRKGKVLLGEGISEQYVTTNEYAYLGDEVQFQGTSGRVASVHAEMVGGIFETTLGFATPGENGAFEMKRIPNSHVIGRMWQGTVKTVEKDKVQVFFHGIDKAYDGSGDVWFAYSTAYSSQDGSGWYSMPAVDDEVRIYFPSDEEKDAFAISALAKFACEDVKDKMWQGIEEKQILMCEKGLIITHKKDKVYIWLSEDGIQIVSDKPIQIASEADVTIKAEKNVNLVGKELLIGTPDTSMDLQKDVLTLTSKEVVVA